MERIANRIAAGIPGPPITCRCRLLASKQINAYSLPGGLIYVTQGLYDRLGSDNSLAAVLAHELAHVVAKDSLKPWRVPPCTKLSREMSADCRGVRYLARAGYSTSSMIDLLHLIRPVLSEEWAEARIQAVVLQEKASAPGPALASTVQASALRWRTIPGQQGLHRPLVIRPHHPAAHFDLVIHPRLP